MRHWLLALFLCLGLLLPWAVAANAQPCAHGPCAAVVAVASAEATAQGAGVASHHGDQAWQHAGCPCCHGGVSWALTGFVPTPVANPSRWLVAWPVHWHERVFTERPERPKWSALA